MKRITARILLTSLFLGQLFNQFNHSSYAYDFDNVEIRLSRNKISASTGGQVCMTTGSTNLGVENNVQLIFPASFTVNSTASNWTTNTTNIPSDATAWPGIGTATNINGQIITFPSSDLTTSTKYCFNFSSSNTLTNPSSTGSYEGTIRTRATTTVIGTQEFAVATANNDQISVSATVPADPADFEANLELLNPQQIYRQNTVLTFRFTYGSYLGTPSNITPEVEWDLGSLTGGQSVEVLQYETGETSNAYNNTPPEIDLVNRKISWNISSFPANTTGQTLTFKLRTTSNYQGPSDIYFNVKGRVLGPGTQTADSTITSIYRYNFTQSSLPGDQKSDGRSDGIGTAEKPLKITYLEVRKISKDTVSILVNTNKLTTPTISYDYKRTDWENSETSNSNAYAHLINLKGLIPNTKYYFRVHTQNGKERIDSELYTFTTAVDSSPIEIDPESLIIISQNIILYDSTNISRSIIPDVTLPTNVLYTLKFRTHNFEQVKKITAISRNNNVLGINNLVNIIPGSDSNTALELIPGQYVTSMTSNNPAGNYNLFLRIEDFNGNISEQSIATLGTVKPMQILEKGTGNPVENSRVRFSIYNERTRSYEALSPEIIPIKNPNYSEPDGTVPVVLPAGKYKAEIESILHENKTVEFTINVNVGDGYPTVELKSIPFNIFNFLHYYATIFDDLRHTINHLIENIKTSNRLLDFAGLFALILFTFLLLEALSHHYSVPLIMVPWFVFYHLTTFYKHKKHEYVMQGVVMDSLTHVGIENAIVYFSRPNGNILGHTSTNSYGEFFETFPSNAVRLTISHKNYRSFTQKYESSKTGKRMTIALTKIKKDNIFTLDGFLWYLRYIFSALFESLIFITLLLEIALIAKFGILRVLPFIFISTISLLLWASLHKNRKIAIKS